MIKPGYHRSNPFFVLLASMKTCWMFEKRVLNSEEKDKLHAFPIAKAVCAQNGTIQANSIVIRSLGHPTQMAYLR